MTEQQPGLRFDIYERVHLHEGVDAIRELNDVELNPHIQVLTQGDQAVLQGNLMLMGSYVSETGEESRTLEHLIPVEITLPLNRIHRVEDILVEIENFDVDLLNARSLNVTGVLSLQGVEMISSPNDSSWREEEEVTFVHEAAWNRSEPAQSGAVSPEPEEQEPPAAVAPPAVEPPQAVAAPVAEAPPVAQAPAVESNPWASAPAVEPTPQVVQAPQAEAVPEVAQQPAAEGNFSVETEIKEIQVTSDPDVGTLVTEEKKEVKLAFGKKAEDAVEVKPFGIKSLLSKAGSYIQGDKKREDTDQQAEEAKGESIEWKRLLLSKGEEAQSFRKVRMCIVQKEETLETIAKRYELNPRELQLLNRLSDTDVSPGQIIYLPR